MAPLTPPSHSSSAPSEDTIDEACATADRGEASRDVLFLSWETSGGANLEARSARASDACRACGCGVARASWCCCNVWWPLVCRSDPIWAWAVLVGPWLRVQCRLHARLQPMLTRQCLQVPYILGGVVWTVSSSSRVPGKTVGSVHWTRRWWCHNIVIF
jgi:hypothetical protein